MLALNCICSYLNWEGARLTLPAPVMEAYHFLPFSSVSTLGGLPFPYFPIPLVFEYVWSLFIYLTLSYSSTLVPVYVWGLSR